MPHVNANGVEPPLRADRAGRRAGDRLRPFDRRDARTCGTRRSPPSPGATAASATTPAATAAPRSIDRAGDGRRSRRRPRRPPRRARHRQGARRRPLARRHDRAGLRAPPSRPARPAGADRDQRRDGQGRLARAHRDGAPRRLRLVHRRRSWCRAGSRRPSPRRTRRWSPASARASSPTTAPAMRPAADVIATLDLPRAHRGDRGADADHRRRRRPGDAGGDVGAICARASRMPRWSSSRRRRTSSPSSGRTCVEPLPRAPSSTAATAATRRGPAARRFDDGLANRKRGARRRLRRASLAAAGDVRRALAGLHHPRRLGRDLGRPDAAVEDALDADARHDDRAPPRGGVQAARPRRRCGTASPSTSFARADRRPAIYAGVPAANAALRWAREVLEENA